ncbi:non-hydrolyzing UDP-N-acetylglucosamine 2-epimerase [Pedobacter agri]|uniref:non-hydrolyzing UDP-N-acetylglucosamine 2-epimerase n=1 Tax=Pedobacter agri TaxID=454586 RepID=UPI00292E3A82|nr:UDP-N-acetylglucosamine 2-epimerase (non-hydrolyzing) [Pedobacter agri]
MKTQIALIYGTRPELLKLIPIINQFGKKNKRILIINTGQHSEVVSELEVLFNIKPDIELTVQQLGYTNNKLISFLIEKVSDIIIQRNIKHVIAQGDTFSVLSASICAFLSKVKFYHIEAGLRTSKIGTPFPEEYNRRVISIGTTTHFAPTKHAANNLLKEGIDKESILMSGNSIIDLAQEIIREKKISITYDELVFITAHRRENLGVPIEKISLAVKTLATTYPHIKFHWSLHPNMAIKKMIFKNKPFPENLIFTDPLLYPDMIEKIAKAKLIISDSGGLQEEASAFFKKILILRDETERPEILNCGLGILVGAETNNIVNSFKKLQENDNFRVNKFINPFGNGKSSVKIVDRILEELKFDSN